MTGWGHFIFCAIDIARSLFQWKWPAHVFFTDYQTLDRLVLWTAQGEPQLLVIVLQPSCINICIYFVF